MISSVKVVQLGLTEVKIMKKRVLKDIKKFTVLLLTALLINTNAITAYAYTVDDLRVFVGVGSIRTEDFREYLDKVIMEYDIANKDMEIASKLSNMKFIDVNEEKYNELKAEQSSVEAEVGDLIGSGKSATAVLEAMNRLEDITKRANKYGNTAMNIKIDTSKSFTDAEEAFKSIQYYLKALEEDDYEIGLIGQGSQSIVGGNWSLYDCYGVNGSESVKFKILSSTETEIYSQFKGVIKKVKENKDGTMSVTINHGYGLETAIKGLNEVYVQKGAEVNQYQSIGKVENQITKGEEMTVLDYVEFYVKLDGEYINPMLIYGTDGLKQLYTWVNEHPGVYVDTDFIQLLRDEIVDTTNDASTDGTMAVESVGYESAGSNISGAETLVPDRVDEGYDLDYYERNNIDLGH